MHSSEHGEVAQEADSFVMWVTRPGSPANMIEGPHKPIICIWTFFSERVSNSTCGRYLTLGSGEMKQIMSFDMSDYVNYNYTYSPYSYVISYVKNWKDVSKSSLYWGAEKKPR